MSQKLRAVLWDMDGTIVDTEPYWMAAESELVASFGGSWTDEQAMELVGNGLLDSARILQETGVDLPAQDIVDLLTDRVRNALRTQGVPFRPGAQELLRGLRAAGVATALVTMSYRRMALSVVEAIGFEAFDVIVAGDEVARPKPFPDPYLRAAELLGIDIADTLAIEDSPTGVRSALASGAVTLAVPHLLPLDALGADGLWESLEGRGPQDLEALFRQTRIQRGERR